MRRFVHISDRLLYSSFLFKAFVCMQESAVAASTWSARSIFDFVHTLAHIRDLVSAATREEPTCPVCPELAPGCPVALTDSLGTLRWALESCLTRADSPRRIEFAFTFSLGFGTGVLLAVLACLASSCFRRRGVIVREEIVRASQSLPGQTQSAAPTNPFTGHTASAPAGAAQGSGETRVVTPSQRRAQRAPRA